MTGFRLPSCGHVDRGRSLGFSFDGHPMQGHPGDTLASALLANGAGVIARSLKYRRPRGIYAAGLDDPCAMLAVTDRHGHDPAIRAGQVVLSDGLKAESVTGWPSPGLDLAAPVTQAFAPILTAGFYYKTLKWPDWSWYEPFVRRATGYGRPSGRPDRRRRSRRHDTCDVLIVGAGPAGLAAAAALADSDRHVVLADQEPKPGGSLRWEDTRIDGREGHVWAEDVRAAVEASGGRYLPSTCVTGAYEGNVFTLLETQPDEGGVAGETLWSLRAAEVVLATGAVDRPLVFQNNDRPGVMLSAAARRFIGEYGVAPGRRLFIGTSDDSGYLTALAAAFAGLEVRLSDARPTPPEALVEGARVAGIEVILGAQVTDTSGRVLRNVTVTDTQNASRRMDCDALALAGGVTPLVHLAAHRGVKPRYNEAAAGFVCPDLPEGWHGAGAVTGTRSLGAALAAGAKAAGAILGRPCDPPQADVAIEIKSGNPFSRPRSGKSSKMFVDLQNDVKASDVELAALENYVSVEHLKRYTTLGMGTDQGRTSNVNGIALLAAETGRRLDEVGTTTFRPPYTAMRLGAIAQHRQQNAYAPRRYLPAHAANAALGAVFEDFGWERPDWYRTNGAEREAAIEQEMRAVREAVGIFDASPLGKIEVAGPDARDFLNRFYVSNIAGLKPGRIRYSVMCRDDGIIFDDGVLTCVDDTLFIAGPTSGNAEAVATWFERWRQTEWPGMRVAIAPVTSQWAALALSGPHARDLVERLEPETDISAKVFPHMCYRETRVAGVPARIARVSFTGELQYEISVPARHGAALLERALELGDDLGARPVGMDAWLRLRLEKGYLHLGSDTNGRTTPLDIGMGGIVAKKPADFIGKRALFLPFNRANGREQLVGLRPVKGAIKVGARVLAEGASEPPCATAGYVSSAAMTKTCGNIGMALIEDGAARMGEIVRIVGDGQIAEAEICPPVFHDPGNERLRA